MLNYLHTHGFYLKWKYPDQGPFGNQAHHIPACTNSRFLYPSLLVGELSRPFVKMKVHDMQQLLYAPHTPQEYSNLQILAQALFLEYREEANLLVKK